jgi:hypothetical protein
VIPSVKFLVDVLDAAILGQRWLARRDTHLHWHIDLEIPVAAEGLCAHFIVVDPAFRIAEMIVLAPEVIHGNPAMVSAMNTPYRLATLSLTSPRSP